MSSAGAAPRAAVPVSNARAQASRRNGAKSGGPKTPEGKARSAQNALKHGLRAQKYMVLPDEDAAEFAALAAAMVEELAPFGALQTVLARRVAVAAWRLARADCLAAGTGLGPRSPTRRPRGRSVRGAELGRRPHPGLALIRDGNGTRSFETVLRYRGAPMAEFWRALKTLKALQAEQALETGPAREAHPKRRAARPPLARRPQPDEPERAAEPRLEYVLREPPAPGRTLREPAAPWLPNEPELRQKSLSAPARPRRAANEPRPHPAPAPDPAKAAPPPARADLAPNEPEPRRLRGTPPRDNHAPAPRGDARHGFPGSHGPSEQMPNPWLRFR